MNICFNILILATQTDQPTPSPVPPPGVGEATSKSSLTDPKNLVNGSFEEDGTIHLDSKLLPDPNNPDTNNNSSNQMNTNATPVLPTLLYTDRLAICHYVCQPKHVTSLMSPIFSKLAQSCGLLEGLFRALEGTDVRLAALLSSEEECVDGGVDSNAAHTNSITTTKKPTTTGNTATTHQQRTQALRTQTKDLRRQRLIHAQSLQEVVADLQDEFLLLEDALKVGLVGLNEQIIEMMLATLVYPVLLQPLCGFMVRCRGSGGVEVKGSGVSSSSTLVERGEPDSALAKTALFVFAITFQLISHRPLLHLMVTALFHPMAPADEGRPASASSSSMATSNLSREDGVLARTASSSSCSTEGGVVDEENELRTDPPSPPLDSPVDRFSKHIGNTSPQRRRRRTASTADEHDIAEDEKASNRNNNNNDEDLLLFYCYSFQSSTDQQIISGDASTSTTSSTSSGGSRGGEVRPTFVLSPALAQLFHRTTITTSTTKTITDNQHHDNSTTTTRSKPNPYRRAVLACLSGTDGMATLQSLAVYALNAMMGSNSLHARVLDKILLGGGVVASSSDWKEGEESPELDNGLTLDQSGGGGGTAASPVSTTTTTTMAQSDLRRSGMNTYMVEVIASMCVSVMAASVPVGGVWSLKFNSVASHAILYASMINEDARITASKLIDHRLRQSASFLSQVPSCLQNNNNNNININNNNNNNNNTSRVDTITIPTTDDSNCQATTTPSSEEIHRQNVIMDRIFFDPFCDDDRCVIEHFIRKRNHHNPSSTTTPTVTATTTTITTPTRKSPARKGKGQMTTNIDSNSSCSNFWTSPGYVSIAQDSGIDDMCAFLCHDPTSLEILVGDDATYRCGANSAVAHLRLDSFSNLLKNGMTMPDRLLRCNDVATFARHSEDMLEYNSSNNNHHHYRHNSNDHTTRTYLKTVSPSFTNLLFEEQTFSTSSNNNINSLQIGSVVTLVGRTAFPCVCEVSKESDPLFADKGRFVVAEGVKWQSLYLVLLNNSNSASNTNSHHGSDEGGYLVLAEPDTGSSGGNGRIVTSCRLSCINVDRDEQNSNGETKASDSGGSSARRLLLTLFSPVPTPPGIFVADPQEKNTASNTSSASGGRDNVRITRSSKDIWFEDSNSAEQAFKALCSKIAKARSKRGHNIRQFLSCSHLPGC